MMSDFYVSSTDVATCDNDLLLVVQSLLALCVAVPSPWTTVLNEQKHLYGVSLAPRLFQIASFVRLCSFPGIHLSDATEFQLFPAHAA